MLELGGIDPQGIEVLLCDADGNLFPSEEPAFVASARVTNRLLASFGVTRRFTPEELRTTTTGRNFRTTAVDLAVACGIPLDPALARTRTTARLPIAAAADRELTEAELERWVHAEKEEVTAHLRETLLPDREVSAPLRLLARRYGLTAVSSSAASRLDACFSATGLAELFPADLRFSAEDSLPQPTSKPDPAVYLLAAARLEIEPDLGLAIEDSAPGAQSSVAAGFPTIGNLQFVPPEERPARAHALALAGVSGVVSSWRELAQLLPGHLRRVSRRARAAARSSAPRSRRWNG